MREKLIIISEKSLKYFLPQTLAQKINNQTFYKNLTQQGPKTSASAVTCSDEIQQKNLKRLLIWSLVPKISDKMHHKTSATAVTCAHNQGYPRLKYFVKVPMK